MGRHNQPNWNDVQAVGGEMGHALMNANVNQLRAELEGPKPLRAIAGIAGLAMAVTAALGLINIFSIFSSPARFVLQMYEVAFGIAIVTIELKDVPCSHRNREFFYKYFPFLTVVGGKGAYMIMAGSLGLGFGYHNLLLFVPSCAVSAIGVVYILFHFSQCKTLRAKYDQQDFLSKQEYSGYH